MIKSKAEKNGETSASGMLSDSFAECPAVTERAVLKRFVCNNAALLVRRKTETVLKQAMIISCENNSAAGQSAGELSDSVSKRFHRK